MIIVIQLLLIYTSISVAQDGAFIAEGERKAFCVLSGEVATSAVDWAISASDKNTLIYYPNSKPKYNPETWSQLNCAFANECTNVLNNEFWKPASSFRYPFIPRTDSAWNDLDIHNTNTFYHIQSKTFQEEDSAHISISVKSASNASLILCDDKDLEHDCYKVTIAEFGTSSSFIRKCIRKKCDIIRGPATTNQILLDEEKWKHFTLSIYKNKTSTELKLLANLKDSLVYAPILRYEDRSQPINAYYFKVQSESDALWKLHKYDFLICKTNIDKGLLYIRNQNYNYLTIGKTELCLSLTVAMCHNCALQLHIETEDRDTFNSNIVYGKK
ncbi:uncharacterized protein LOC113383626 [Ctenocephalides felis]|uniref:uncharacterized protein LOC113383626 n=1 Tax=Ctenocephalides felis TaxID=7515 RepID=UPI000E6E38F0|nr:uncharacterized protein LOC113383626 [Ctenocephalides felis]